MAPNLFHTELPVANLVLRALVVYAAVLFLLRISGKRQVGQMGAIELVTILLISNAVQNSMNGGDNSLVGGLVLAAILIAISMILARLSFRSRAFEAVIEGTPRLVVHDGKAVHSALEKERLALCDLRTLLRKQGVHRIADLKSAVLEADGSLSLIRYDDVVDPNASAAHVP